MKELLIDIGKSLFYLGIARTTNGISPNDEQCYGIGLYFFIFFLICFALVLLIYTFYLIKKIKNKTPKIEIINEEIAENSQKCDKKNENKEF